MKENVDICAPKLAEIFNSCIQNGIFPSELKLADISPIFKAVDSTAKKNYRPVSILNSISKLFEKLIQKQLNPFFDKTLSEHLCGYRKGYTTQYALLKLIESWKKYRDNKGYSAAVLMDLSKAFDTINHDLLLAKLHAYGVCENSLKLIMNYLKSRYQRTKINDSFSGWEELLTGVPQGSVLGPLLFNIYLNDLFYAVKNSELCNFADDTTPYACGFKLNEVVKNVEDDCKILVSWFKDNYLTLNAEKCHLIISGNIHDPISAKVGDATIWEEDSVKLLGVIIDSQLTFNNHVKSICTKASQKLTALFRMVNLLSEVKRRLLIKTFFESQFNYCPLLWMFCDRSLNHKINRLHERSLRLAYNDYSSTFQDLLIKDKTVTIHQRNLRALAIEMYKISHDLSPDFMKDILTKTHDSYPTRSNCNVKIENDGSISHSQKSNFRTPKVNTVTFGLESFRCLGPKIWKLVPDNLKEIDSLQDFKEALKNFTFNKCPCRLCKDYIHGVGYIN